MKKLLKLLKRISRLLKYKSFVFGRIGYGNQFGKDTFISEGAVIGSYNYFGPQVMVNNCTIANYCSIGPGVKIGQAEHSTNYWTTSQLISKKNINHSLNIEPTLIENDVWLAANVIVLQGVKVGTGAIIGAGAVVTNDIPNYAIAVGVPAKVIKYRFDQPTIDALLDTRWFDKSPDEASKILKQFQPNSKGGVK
ncbi:CatB-related O-acetyltransferase [Staphylococcus simulans]|uniref:CatB-related O-acetyltransferase n=1 Tax=Staphylococcus simulans TaxID=1286 RepID=UPI00399A6B10